MIILYIILILLFLYKLSQKFNQIHILYKNIAAKYSFTSYNINTKSIQKA